MKALNCKLYFPVKKFNESTCLKKTINFRDSFQQDFSKKFEKARIVLLVLLFSSDFPSVHVVETLRIVVLYL